ncbi:MAG: OsmC family protein [Proteobacteria bacterium]|jgi:organic hydroperoxide reductase OsmC/OhrA|nr:OsmC family protein [Pseudomonadota bacterium]MDA1299208.1 OsmC family protein [Pseudomonadota bacterium]
MDPFPHHYRVTSEVTPDGNVLLSSEGLTDLTTAAPSEFGGPGDQWSPETLLVAAVTNCYLLSFRAIAANSGLAWTDLACSVDGQLEQVDRSIQFTRFTLDARLQISDPDVERLARRILDKAERSCLISNSLKAPVEVRTEIILTNA